MTDDQVELDFARLDADDLAYLDEHVSETGAPGRDRRAYEAQERAGEG